MVLPIQDFFPFSPEYSTWEDYNGNLVVFFASEPIGVNSEENWKNTVADMVNLPRFMNYPIPDPNTYENWQDWANNFSQVLNGPSY